MTDSEPNGPPRPKTSATTTSSPRNKLDGIAKSRAGNSSGNVNGVSNSGGTINAKKRLAVPPQVVRPQTSPEIVMPKHRVATNRTQGRLRTSNAKQKAGNATQRNSNCFIENMQGIFEEKPMDVQEDNKQHSVAEVLVVAGSGVGFNDGALSEEARPITQSLGQGFGEIESISGLSNTDKQSKEASPPSRNNRYGNGIKTRLAKLFNKGNACMEEPKVVEPHRNLGIDHSPHLSQAISGNQRPTRY